MEAFAANSRVAVYDRATGALEAFAADPQSISITNSDRLTARSSRTRPAVRRARSEPRSRRRRPTR
ncbi:hypothetical protein EXE41_02315 [Halorubrum sp. SD690R]|nr:hypothetical protein EXE41_02315 [Halorubrum sp. SD690R]